MRRRPAYSQPGRPQPKAADRIATLRKELEGVWQPGGIAFDGEGKACNPLVAERMSVGGMAQKLYGEWVSRSRISYASDIMAHLATVLAFTQGRKCVMLWEDEVGREWGEVEALLLSAEDALRTGAIGKMQTALMSSWDMQSAHTFGRDLLRRFFRDSVTVKEAA